MLSVGNRNNCGIKTQLLLLLLIVDYNYTANGAERC